MNIKIIVIVLCLCAFSFAIGCSVGEHKANKCLAEYALVADTAGMFSDIIRMHQDHSCPTIEEDIEIILDNSESLNNYAYCY